MEVEVGVVCTGRAGGEMVWMGASTCTEWNGPREAVSDVEVQNLSKWGYPDEEERGAL